MLKRLCTADCTFANLGGDGFVQDACFDCSAAVNAVNASVTIANCTFFHPAPLNGTAYIRAFNGGRLRITGCEFAPTPDLQFSPFVALPDTAVYSDDASMAFRDDGGAVTPPKPLAAAPSLPETSPLEFLTRDDEWFVAMQEVRHLAIERRSVNADDELCDASPAGHVHGSCP